MQNIPRLSLGEGVEQRIQDSAELAHNTGGPCSSRVYPAGTDIAMLSFIVVPIFLGNCRSDSATPDSHPLQVGRGCMHRFDGVLGYGDDIFTPWMSLRRDSLTRKKWP